MKVRCVFLATIALFGSSMALAIPIQWTLSNVTLADGQTLTGSFIFDRNVGSQGSYSSISITNSGTVANPATTWNNLFIFNAISNPVNANGPSAVLLTNGPLNQTNRGLTLYWNQLGQQLTNAGGTLLLRTDQGGIGWTCRNSSFVVLPDCSDAYSLGVNIGQLFAVSGGSIIGTSVVPVPAAAWLLGGALLCLGGLRRRR